MYTSEIWYVGSIRRKVTTMAYILCFLFCTTSRWLCIERLSMYEKMMGKKHKTFAKMITKRNYIRGDSPTNQAWSAEHDACNSMSYYKYLCVVTWFHSTMELSSLFLLLILVGCAWSARLVLLQKQYWKWKQPNMQLPFRSLLLKRGALR